MEQPFTITYTNYFKVGNRTFAFRKKELFEISNTPKYMPIKNNSGSKGWWINKEWFSLDKIKQLIINKSINIDVTNLAWYTQIELNEVFNLHKL